MSKQKTLPLENILFQDFEKNLKEKMLKNIVSHRDLQSSIEKFKYELGGYVDNGKRY